MTDVLAVVRRSDLDEAFHTGAAAVADLSGTVVGRFGDIDRPFWIRSAAKPFQATVAVESGADLPPEHLAVACASHDGTSTHVAIVRAILADGGLGESDLGCPPDRPMSPAADRALAADGLVDPQRVAHNCSGKHAAMLRACVASDWPTATYLEPTHPLQRSITRHMVDIGAALSDEVGVDGCGAPVHRVSLRTVAAGYTALLDDRHERIWTAMHRYPALTSGTGNADAVIAVGLDAVAKRGAEGLLAVAVRGRGSMAVRCWDGSSRAVAAAARRVLVDLGWISEKDALADSLERRVVGGGRTVGTVTAPFRLEPA